jgi:hypothetical protein
VIVVAWWVGLMGCASVSEPEPAADPADAIDEAMAALATAMGGGWVRCELPEEAPGGVPRVLDGFVHRQGDTVAFVVPEPDGVALMYPSPPPYPDADAGEAAVRAYAAMQAAADTPFAVAHYTRASGEVRGVCGVADPAPLSVQGTVTGAEGGRVEGCGVDVRVVEGAFSFDTHVGEPCELRHSSDPLGPPTVLDRANPPESLVVTGRSEPRTMNEKVEARVAEAEASVATLQARVDALGEARGAVSESAAAVLQLWQAQMGVELGRRKESRDKIVAFRDALTEAQATYGDKPKK